MDDETYGEVHAILDALGLVVIELRRIGDNLGRLEHALGAPRPEPIRR